MPHTLLKNARLIDGIADQAQGVDGVKLYFTLPPDTAKADAAH